MTNVMDCDVAIVGGGLAGASLAVALHGTPLRVVLIEAVSDEARLASGAGDRGIALAQGSAELLDRLGLWAGARDKATPIRKIHVSDRGHFGKARIDAEQEKVDALGYVIAARELERQAIAALSDLAIERIVPGRVIGAKAGPDSICLTVRQDDAERHINARLLVGADGGDSSVRRLLEIGEEVTDYGQVAVTATVKPQRDPAGLAFERFTPEGPLALLPTENRCCAVVWTRKPEQAESLMALSDERFTAELQAAFGQWLGRLTLCAPRRKFPLKLVRARRLTVPRAVLIGNAAHQLHPVAGQGFNLGLRDAARLAEMLAAAAEAGVDVGAPDLLERFAVERTRDHDRVIGFTDSMVKWFSTEQPAAALARNIGMVLLDHIPAAKRFLARQAMGRGWRSPRLPLGK
ncbi:2-octaprenyl-6-methoxyphenyl hydroxylase [Methylogaea oryzae]|uniref:2-octaprenyl-6-methoxyphenyl hydroxylase n=2 Tax=Methylogaea oryzae TaxID=1295382 RepID=A0A8D4VST5_9GAMM|nr:2-octaprenyl-6-methoxyphenyl hydroxylase [Methylogaea oryzae]BBL72639.1 2-octaprenyl-6-methoxyphenyl hydroxylase [Methylogaea oryzae]